MIVLWTSSGLENPSQGAFHGDLRSGESCEKRIRGCVRNKFGLHVLLSGGGCQRGELPPTSPFVCSYIVKGQVVRQITWPILSQNHG
jgi:hypothetical protein